MNVNFVNDVCNLITIGILICIFINSLICFFNRPGKIYLIYYALLLVVVLSFVLIFSGILYRLSGITKSGIIIHINIFMSRFLTIVILFLLVLIMETKNNIRIHFFLKWGVIGGVALETLVLYSFYKSLFPNRIWHLGAGIVMLSGYLTLITVLAVAGFKKKRIRLFEIGLTYFVFLSTYLSCFISLNVNIFTGNYISFSLYALILFVFQVGYNKEYKLLKQYKNNLEEEVFKRTGELEAEKKAKTEFFLKFAHETKTPLAIITNYLSEYISEVEKNPKLQLIKQNIDKLSTHMVHFMESEKTGKKIDDFNHDSIVDLSLFLEQKIVLFGDIARKKKVAIEKNIKKGIFLKADPAALDGILNNLLDNGLKYNSEPGMIRLSLFEEKGHNESRVTLLVSDTGKGIPEEEQDKVFAAYFQGQKSVSPGIGMGLYIVKKIIHTLDGKISIKSGPQKGTTFVLDLGKSLPAPAENDRGEGDLEKSQSSLFETKPFLKTIIDKIPLRPYDQGKSTILVVEDNLDLIYYLKIKLEGDFNFFYAVNGKRALQHLEHIPEPDIIISDVKMEEMDGYELLEELSKNEHYKHIPVILLTGNTTTSDKIEGLKAGAVSYVYKPFSFVELEAKISVLLEKKENYALRFKDRIMQAISLPEKGTRYKRAYLINKICAEKNISVREREVLRHLLKGKSYKEISNKICISVHTVKSHAHAIYKKMDVTNKTELLYAFNLSDYLTGENDESTGTF